MRYALANLLRNLRAGLRLACFLRVDRLAFRIDLAQLVLLFLLSAAIDVAGDWFQVAPPRQFAPEGAASELYYGALLLFICALIALGNRQRQVALSLAVIIQAATPVLQILHYVPAWLARGSDMLELLVVLEKLIVTWIVLVLIRCVAVAFSPPPSFVWLRAIVGGLALSIPIWTGSLLLPSLPWWRDGGERAAPATEFNAGAETVLAAQAIVLDDVLDDLADERPGETDLYFVGFAPWGRSDAWRNEVERARQVMDARWGAEGRSVLLVNNPRTLISVPFATLTNLRETLNEIGGIIDPDHDIVMLYLTGPTARDNRLAAEQPPLTLVEVGPAGLKRLLADAGITWRIVVVSACYSGGFVAPLEDEHTLIVTDAGVGGTSLACDGRAPPTLFGDTFFQQGLGKGHSFEASFEMAKRRVAEREREAGYPASQPQWSMGSAMAAKIKTIRRPGADGAGTAQGARPPARG
ncbi:MAG: hypothetical protein IT518_16865 [Burkholderiales bacterium]|nr:hypothetical protein [Burkholderiales bacterium]